MDGPKAISCRCLTFNHALPYRSETEDKAAFYLNITQYTPITHNTSADTNCTMSNSNNTNQQQRLSQVVFVMKDHQVSRTY